MTTKYFLTLSPDTRRGIMAGLNEARMLVSNCDMRGTDKKIDQAMSKIYTMSRRLEKAHNAQLGVTGS